MTYDEFEKLMDEEIDKAFNIKMHNIKAREEGKEDLVVPEYNCKSKVKEYYQQYVDTLKEEMKRKTEEEECIENGICPICGTDLYRDIKGDVICFNIACNFKRGCS